MTNPANEVWVFVEQRDGKPADVGFELLSKGRKLADSMGARLKSIVIGESVRPIAVETFRYGTDESFIIEHPHLRQYRTMPYSRVLN